MKQELLAALRAGRARPGGPGGRADRRRPGVLRRPGPQGVSAGPGRSPTSCATATTRLSGRCDRSSQPIVGAINGVAAGAGASLAFACDIRVAAEDASFVLAFGRIGLVPDSGVTWFLPRLVGPARAAELALRRRALRPTTPSDSGWSRASCRRRRSPTKLGRSPSGWRRRRRVRSRSRSGPSSGAGRSTSRTRSRTRRGARGSPAPSADHAEGLAAFIEKRPPRFTGE